MDSFFTFLIAITLLTIAPGADTVLVIRNALRGGLADGVATSVAICSGLFVHATVSAVGISLVILQSAWMFTALKLLGAGYLLWLGVMTFVRASQTVEVAPVHSGQFLLWRSCREGLLSNVLNPKPIVFYMAFLPQFIERQKKNLEKEVATRTREVIHQKEELETQAAHLAELNDQKNRLLSIVSHDLRNPLASLQSITSLINSEVLTDKDLLKDFQTRITEQIEHLGSSMINLLEWAKSQMEGEQMNPQMVDLKEISNDVIELYLASAEKKHIKISNEINQNTFVYADVNHVRVIFRNLIGNAIKFTNTNGARLVATKDILPHTSKTQGMECLRINWNPCFQ